ncbi:MAG: hypothetical protein MSS61_05915 [Bacteroidales bacterium]|nr:hypothetical protein [Bacteroidales bacterium]
MQTPIRNILFLIIMALSLQAPVACSDDAVVSGGYDEGKTSIELSVGGVGEVNASRARAITKDPNEVAKRGIIPAGTALYMVMKSENAVSSPTETKYAVTRGVTKDADAERKSPIDFSQTGCTRYWDDCFARNAHLTIYAACAPGSTKTIEIGGKSVYPWTSMPTTEAWSNTAISPTIVDWTVSNNQTTETLRDEDLCYSNNISKYTEGIEQDKRLKFNSSTRKFDQGNLCFYHALSWITFEIIRDTESFTAQEFQFATGTNIKLTNFFTKNTEFDIPTGEFTGAYSSQTIQTMAQRATATTGSAFTLDALVMPTTDMSSPTKGDIHLIIANNEYNLSKKELLDKIQELDKTNHLIGGTQLKPGVHYVFKLRIGKTKIKEITATILDWETVTATEHTPSNAKVILNLEDRTGTKENAYIYRAAETTANITGDILSEGKGYVWEKGYEERNAYTASTDVLGTTWYWPDNKTFYHFRAIAPQSAPAPITVGNKDCVALASGDSYTDVCWGAPFPEMEPGNPSSNTTKFVYSLTNGFAGTDGHQIHYAIGATESPLKLLLFHMMSDVTINIRSVTGDAQVDLGDGTSTTTKIELKNIYTAGRVQLGNGLVLGTGTQTGTHTFPLQGGTTLTWSNYGAIPQSLAGVVLEITTPDHNHYLIDLASVKASASNISSKNVQNPYAIVDGKCTINRWYPDYKYTYSFTLSKKGVAGITCTILEWEEVTADDEVTQIQ